MSTGNRHDSGAAQGARRATEQAPESSAGGGRWSAKRKMSVILELRLGPRRQKRKHDFAFSGMITCGQCGCAKRYVREEVLEAEFVQAIRQLAFDAEFLSDVKVALQQFHSKESEEREQTITRLQAEQTKLARRIEAMYEDKLDGTIDEALYKRKSDESRAEQARLAEEITRLEQARPAHVYNFAELADRAAELFEQQPAGEKRKLLQHVVEGCKWTAGQLTFRWKPPFEKAVRVQAARAA